MLFILIIRMCFCLLPASPCWGWRTPKVQAAVADTLLVEVGQHRKKRLLM